MLTALKEHYTGKKVFVTGHTGFKGAWLTLWLKKMGAEVVGYSLPAANETNLFDLLALEKDITHIEADIRDFEQLQQSLRTHQPDIVLHLAAQALVLDAYKWPKETFEINSSGTLNVLEGIRKNPHIKAGVMVTTDKCYENRSWLWGYRENDPLGGKDPYSASKSMAELCIEAYRHSFFRQGQDLLPQIAAVRAGNIIGGGDFAAHRILPDSVKALMQAQEIQVRNPKSARPWLYVLDALHGYSLVGARLMSASGYAESWNFGPKENRGITVAELVEKCIDLWGAAHGFAPLRPRCKKRCRFYV